MMSDTSTEEIKKMAALLEKRGTYQLTQMAFQRLLAIVSERDKWHTGWMEAEAKVSELEAERDALKAERHEAAMALRNVLAGKPVRNADEIIARAAFAAMLAEAEKRGLLRGAEIYRNELAKVAASAEAGPVFEAALRAEAAIHAEAEE